MTNTNSKKKFLFIGDSDTDGARSRLAVSTIPYVKKKLESGPENWQKIIDIVDQEDLIGVLVKLSNLTMKKMLHPNYANLGEELLEKISQLPHIVFVHSSFFGLQAEQDTIEKNDEDDWFGGDSFFSPLEEEEREAMMELFGRQELNTVPYKRNVELSVLAADFVDTHQSNLIFRFYVPSRKIYAEQTSDVLALFRDYLTRSLNLEVKQSTHTTASGTIHEFYGDGEMSRDDVTSKFVDFSEIMDLCVNDASRAELLLVEQGADAEKVGRLVTDYSKRLRRISADVTQERERKVLEIRHRLEIELIEEAPASELASIRQLVDQVIPSQEHVADVLGLGASRITQTGGGDLVINIRPQFVDHMQGVVAQEVYGDQNIGPEPSQLLDLIRESNSDKAVLLQSAVYELEDQSSSPEKRLSAGRVLQAFLSKVGEKAGEKVLDVGIASLQAYIQGKLGNW